MKGNDTLFRNFMDSSSVRLVIPVYQRNYDWKIGNCDQLFDDLVKASRLESEYTHFFGSIVEVSGRYHERIIIDGQQRITTVSLLLMAAIQAVKDGKMSIRDPFRTTVAISVYLKAENASGDRKIKLEHVESDREAYDKIFNSSDSLDESSNMTRNYRHFYQLITERYPQLTFDELLLGIDKLKIIEIMLDDRDDAQLIFESLNSTGLALSEADKVRNYLLMALSNDMQKECYSLYWKNIEKATGGNSTMFLRDYLTIRQKLSKHVKIDRLYFEWKVYMKERNRVEEMKKMLEYAELYRKLATCCLDTDKLSNKARLLRNMDSDVPNVFFVEFLRYAALREMSEDEVFNVFDIVENYLVRRMVCGMSTNSLTGIFCVLHREIVRLVDEYCLNGHSSDGVYAEALKYYFLKKDGKYSMPKDVEFKEAILTKEIYKVHKPFKIFLFERLENQNRTEKIDVVAELKANEVTIEHIMPQKLTSEWKLMLGENSEEIHNRYLHTFANLTLTGINSELGNKDFLTKRDGRNGCQGYRDSKYRLTMWVTQCDKWTKEELDLRGQEIANALFNLYPLLQSQYQPILKSKDEASLADDDFSPVGRKIKGFRLFDDEYEVDSWKKMMVSVVRIVMDKYPDEVEALINDPETRFFVREGDPNLTLESYIEQYCAEFSSNRYVLTGIDNKQKIQVLKTLFEACDIEEESLVFLLEKEE